MKITGYKLREALKYWGLQRDSAQKSFSASLYKFKDEVKAMPSEAMSSFIEAETSIAMLHLAQMQYNLAVRVVVNGHDMSLAEAIKRVVFSGKVEKMWTSVGDSRKRSYMDDDLVRDANQERAAAVLKPEEALERATHASRKCGALRSAIAVGNATEIELDLNPSLIPEG